MIVRCQKCGKEYEPKRRGGKFCSTSCRVVQHQLSKRSGVWIEPAVRYERYLAAKLLAVGESASKVLEEVKGLSAEAELAELRKLIVGWKEVANNIIIERIQEAENREKAK